RNRLSRRSEPAKSASSQRASVKSTSMTRQSISFSSRRSSPKNEESFNAQRVKASAPAICTAGQCAPVQSMPTSLQSVKAVPEKPLPVSLATLRLQSVNSQSLKRQRASVAPLKLQRTKLQSRKRMPSTAASASSRSLKATSSYSVASKAGIAMWSSVGLQVSGESTPWHSHRQRWRRAGSANSRSGAAAALQLRAQLGLAPEQRRLVALEGAAKLVFVHGPVLAQRCAGLLRTQWAAAILHEGVVAGDHGRVGLVAAHAVARVVLLVQRSGHAHDAQRCVVAGRLAVGAQVGLAVGGAHALVQGGNRCGGRWRGRRYGSEGRGHAVGRRGCSDWRRLGWRVEGNSVLALRAGAGRGLVAGFAVRARASVHRLRDAGRRQADAEQREDDGQGRQVRHRSFRRTEAQKAASWSSAAKPSVTAPSPTLTMPVMLIGASSKVTPHSSQAVRRPV